MSKFAQKQKRQIELLAYVFSSKNKITSADLAYKFNCKELTIKRDMSELRSDGIDIHSTASKGIKVENNFSVDKLNELVNIYISSSILTKSYNKASRLLVNKLHESSIVFLTLTQNAIENSTKIEIVYKNPEEKLEKIHLIEPMMIFESEGNWRILARDDEILTQFLIENIKSMSATEIRFRKIARVELMRIFETSFRSWHGENNKFHIKLSLSQEWADRIKSRLIFEYQNITIIENGEIILEAVVNSLDEVASWIAGTGNGIKVLKPKELREKVTKIAASVLNNH